MLTINLFYDITGLYEKTKQDEVIKNWFVKDTIINTLLTSKCISDDSSNTQSDTKHFFLFLDTFGESIAEFSNFNKKERKNKLFQMSCTPSDEAFGIFTLERCWDTWMKEEITSKKEAPRSSSYTIKNSNQKYSGWSKVGLKRFSDIANAVMNARDNDDRKNMEEEYRLHYEKEHLTRMGLLYGHDVENAKYKSPEQGNAYQVLEDEFIAYNDLPGGSAFSNPNIHEEEMDDTEDTDSDDETTIDVENEDSSIHNTKQLDSCMVDFDNSPVNNDETTGIKNYEEDEDNIQDGAQDETTFFQSLNENQSILDTAFISTNSPDENMNLVRDAIMQMNSGDTMQIGRKAAV